MKARIAVARQTTMVWMAGVLAFASTGYVAMPGESRVPGGELGITDAEVEGDESFVESEEAEAIESRRGGEEFGDGTRVRIPESIWIGGDGRVDRDEETPQVVVVLGSGAVDGRVRHDMVVVLGRATINGEVEGDLISVLGEVEFGARARVKGDLVVVGGSVRMTPGSRVDGQSVDLSWEQMEKVPGFSVVAKMAAGAKDWFVEGLMLGRLLPAHGGWWWWVALSSALLYVLVGLMVPGAVKAGAWELESQPVAAFFIGILGYLLLNVLFLVLGATGIGVLAWPFCLIALLIIQVVGKASVYQLAGQRLGRQLGGGTLQQPMPALVAGLALFTLIYMIPAVGLLAWLAIAPLGLGAALMAMFRALRGRPEASTLAARGELPGTPDLTEPSADGLDADYGAKGPVAGPPPVIGSVAAVPLVTAAEMASLPRAGFWIRLVATLLDFMVVFMPLVALHSGDYFLIPWIAYHVGMWTWKGTTVGGVVCRLKVVRADGQRLNFAVALVRSLASVLSALALFLGFFWVGWRSERLAWHDMIAGTAIVKVPRGIPLL